MHTDHSLSRLLTMDLTFISTFHFILFCFVFLLFFYFQNNSGQGSSVTLSHQSQIDGIVTRLIMRLGESSRRFWNKVTSYSMDNTCWPHVILMVIQGRVHSSQHGLWVIVYKVDYFVLGTLSSSLVSLNTRVSSLLNTLSIES